MGAMYTMKRNHLPSRLLNQEKETFAEIEELEQKTAPQSSTGFMD
jgi:hypothetical protein